MHDDDGHPNITDAGGTTWTWRGHGYAVRSQPDRDWLGRAWTTSADTIRAKYGKALVPMAART